jgi:hypothetical protein
VFPFKFFQNKIPLFFRYFCLKYIAVPLSQFRRYYALFSARFEQNSGEHRYLATLNVWGKIFYEADFFAISQIFCLILQNILQSNWQHCLQTGLAGLLSATCLAPAFLSSCPLSPVIRISLYNLIYIFRN